MEIFKLTNPIWNWNWLEIFIEQRDFYIAGDTVNCMLMIHFEAILKSKYVMITAFGEVYGK
jgi:hypothetical protein